MVAAFEENVRTQAVPPRFTAGAALRGSPHWRTASGNARAFARPRGGPGSASASGGGTQPSAALPMRSKLRVVVMFFVLVGSVLHQLSMRYDIETLRRVGLGLGRR